MLQAAFSDCQFLNLLPFSDDGFAPSEVDVGGCDVVQALVVSFVVVVIDKGPDLEFEITGQVIVFQKHPVLHGLMPKNSWKPANVACLGIQLARPHHPK